METFESLVEANLLEGVAEEIRKQIKALDFWAFAAWGAKNFVKSDKGFNLPDTRGTRQQYGPGLQFDVRGSKLKRGGRVYVTYERGLDLYTVVGGRITRKDGVPTWVTTAVVERISFEDLIDVINGIVG